MFCSTAASKTTPFYLGYYGADLHLSGDVKKNALSCGVPIKKALEDMVIIGTMPVKSLITFPKSGLTHPLAGKLTVRGHAWTG